MSIKIGLIHTTINSMQPIIESCREYAPEITVLNFLDEGLMEQINKHGGITPEMIRQLINLIDKAEKSNVDGILLACSAFSPYVADIKKLFAVPVLSADISMLEQAVEMAGRIGIIATVGAAGPTTTCLLKEIAEGRNKKVEIHTAVITEAFTALKNGDTARHDKLIQTKIFELSADCDVIVLAQMSMTRALKNLRQISKPVLTSPEISVKAILAQVAQNKQK